jgi:hypothetical protein
MLIKKQMDIPNRNIPLTRRLPKTSLPKTIPLPQPISESPVPSVSSTVENTMTTNVPPEIAMEVIPVPNVPLPPSTMQWNVRNIKEKVYAGDLVTVPNGTSSCLESRASKLHIKSDGVYCLQANGLNCVFVIEAMRMNGIDNETPIVLVNDKNFASVTCFLRRNDIIALSATPIVTQPKFDPNMRIRVEDMVRRVKQSENSVCFSVSLI